jgi:peptide/nickel transport system ATP-binding protein/oligopeptide transport system ATP-binding protein
MTQNNTADSNNNAMMDTSIRNKKTKSGERCESGNRLLTVKDLTVCFSIDEGTFVAADRISFYVEKGENVGLVGESGCGKSVTALSIPRLIPSPPGTIESGEIWFDGRDIMSMTSEELRDIRGRAISMIFQEPLSALSPLHRIGRQMTETLLLHRDMSQKEAWQFAEQWLGKVGIPDAADRMFAYPFQLSGGMQQRIMIAMALMLAPNLIIADEPTTALDVTTQAQVFELIKAMKKKHTSMLLITHDMGVVWEMCERILVMYASRIVESGSREDIFSNPKHPYTIGLLNAIPKLTGARRQLKDIPGQVPSPFDYPKGCHFEKRCAFSMERCITEKPPFYDCGNGHRAACFLLAGK